MRGQLVDSGGDAAGGELGFVFVERRARKPLEFLQLAHFTEMPGIFLEMLCVFHRLSPPESLALITVWEKGNRPRRDHRKGTELRESAWPPHNPACLEVF